MLYRKEENTVAKDSKNVVSLHDKQEIQHFS